MPSPAPEARGVTAPFHTTSRGRERAGTWQQLGCKTGSQESRAPPRLRCGDLRDPPKRSPSGCVRPRTPAPSPARPPPRVGTPFLLACPSSASSVSQGKAVASFWAPHPRLGNPLSCLRHPSPVSPRQRLLLCASGSRRAARAPSPPGRAAESQRVGEASEMSDILKELLRVSEKAANIARACRQQETLFQLLIQEKKDEEKNKKFATDFKTLADVLVQEVIKQNMENKFPGLGKKILGEESNEFTNDLGEKITVELQSTEEETAELLSRVLNGNMLASEALAKVVHQDVDLTDPSLEALEISIPQDILGIWVDPIDSTYQYIKGSANVKSNQGVFPNGLQCVTILIGVYDIQTGMPLMGVINQPFVSQNLTTLRWKGQYYWGLSYMGTNIHSLQFSIPKGNNSETHTENLDLEFSRPFSAVISTSEKETIKAAMSRICEGGVFSAAGAGYKSLCVVQGLVDIYIFSEDTTYKWDSCAAHAILRAMGGGIVDMKECLARSPELGLDLPQLLYHMENKGASGVDLWANKGGLIAYRSRHRLDTFLSCLTQNLGPLKTQT